MTYEQFLEYAQIQAPELVEYDPSKIILFIWTKDGVRQFSRIAKSQVVFRDVTIGTESYGLPSNFLSLTGLYDPGRKGWLTPIQPISRDFNTGLPDHYFADLQRKLVYLSPIPVASRSYKLVYTPLLGITNDDGSPIAISSTFPVHDAYWEALVHYLRYRLLLVNSEAEGKWQVEMAQFRNGAQEASDDAFAATGPGVDSQVQYRDID